MAKSKKSKPKSKKQKSTLRSRGCGRAVSRGISHGGDTGVDADYIPPEVHGSPIEDEYCEKALEEFTQQVRDNPLDERSPIDSYDKVLKDTLGYIPVDSQVYDECKEKAEKLGNAMSHLETEYRRGTKESIHKAEKAFFALL